MDGKVKAASANDDWYRKVLNEQSGIDGVYADSDNRDEQHRAAEADHVPGLCL